MLEDKKPSASERVLPVLGRPGVEALIDSQRAAEVLGIHPRTLQRMVHRGEIHAVHIGKLWRFRPSTLAQWIDQQLAS